MAPKRQRDDDDAAATTQERKRTKSAVDEAFAELVCPITQSLPVDPVTAEDGNVYERAAIADWLSKNKRSPLTNEPMGVKLLPAVKVKNLIRTLVKSGEVAGDKADAWQAKLKEEEEGEGWRRAAEAGDVVAMYRLGEAYDTGSNGVTEDSAEALKWFRRVDAAGNATATARVGYFTAVGRGGATACPATSAALLGQAAERGSRFACFLLGVFFKNGLHGFPKDPVMARRWFSKVADATIHDSSPSFVDEAATWLLEHPA